MATRKRSSAFQATIECTPSKYPGYAYAPLVQMKSRGIRGVDCPTLQENP